MTDNKKGKMNRDRLAGRASRRVPGRGLTLMAAAVLAQFAVAPQSWAFQFDTGNPDLKILWDTTVKYSSAFRLEDADSKLLAEPFSHWPNTDDGNRNFRKTGLVSNRLDVLTELDFIYKRSFGFRVSGAAWYDTEYFGKNDNNSPATANNRSVAHDRFTHDTRDLHGSDAEILDAFVFGRFELGERPLTMRLGQHTLLWGESLFFGANGIANAQAPIDVVKAASVPNTQFKELMRPVNQISGQLQLTPDIAVGAYYQFEWEQTRLPGAGSYFSGIDFLSEGGERLIVGEAGGPFANAPAFFRARDVKASDSGQGGVQLRLRAGEVDYGLYAVRYHEKAPQIYLRPQAVPDFGTGQIGSYVWVYPEEVRAYGASATTTFGAVNVAGEVSVRHNTPLASDAQLDLAGTGDNDGNPLYGVGDSAHAQVSALASVGPHFIAREADVVAEIAWNRVTRITKNKSAINPNATREATNLRVIYEPKYRQVLPGVDLSVPIGVGYGLDGNSMAVGAFNGEDVGDVSIGVSGSYLDVWRFGVSYTHYFGPVDNMIDADGHGSYKQSLADRDFISLTLRRTF